MAMNQKAREELDKKQAEVEKLQRLNEVSISCIHIGLNFNLFVACWHVRFKCSLYLDGLWMQPEGNIGVDGDKDKDEGRGKSLKVILYRC